MVGATVVVVVGAAIGIDCHAGLLLRPPTVAVTRVCPVPSAFITKISSLRFRLLANAIWLPSGDHVGE